MLFNIIFIDNSTIVLHWLICYVPIVKLLNTLNRYSLLYLSTHLTAIPVDCRYDLRSPRNLVLMIGN